MKTSAMKWREEEEEEEERDRGEEASESERRSWESKPGY